MSEQIWYIYQNEQQLGPFTSEQVLQLSASNMVAQDAYLFKAGWQEWRLIKDCQNELNPKSSNGSSNNNVNDGRLKPRALVNGRVIVHNNGEIDFTSGLNVSETGIFIETKNILFNVGDTVKITIQLKQLSKAYNAFAKVIRHNKDPKNPVGFGLMFDQPDSKLIDDIRNLFSEDAQAPLSKFGR